MRRLIRHLHDKNYKEVDIILENYFEVYNTLQQNLIIENQLNVNFRKEIQHV